MKRYHSNKSRSFNSAGSISEYILAGILCVVLSWATLYALDAEDAISQVQQEAFERKVQQMLTTQQEMNNGVHGR